MVTLRESNAEANPFIACDNARSVWAKHPTGAPPRYDWKLTTTANIKAGMIVKLVAGATGGYSIVELAGTDRDAWGFVEFDPKQIADCTVAYASGDLVPVIPLQGNAGVILRNIILLNPAAALNPGTDLQADAVGVSVQDGTGLVVGKLENYLTNPAANTTIVMKLGAYLDFAV